MPEGLQGPRTVIPFAKFAELDMSVSAPAARVLRFDIFELDLRAGELRKRGVKLRLQGQPLEILAILLQRAGDVIAGAYALGTGTVRKIWVFRLSELAAAVARNADPQNAGNVRSSGSGSPR